MGYMGAETPGWFGVPPKNSAWDLAWVGKLLWWSCQWPVAHSCSLLNHLNSFHEGMFKLNAKFDADSLLCSRSHLNAKATQYPCSLDGIYHPHWLLQWNCHCSRTHIPVHSSWLSGYIDATQTVLIMLTMVGLFSDRPSYVHQKTCTRMFAEALCVAPNLEIWKL